MASIQDTIKKAILTDGRSRYRIAKDSGISEAQLSRFVHGQRGGGFDMVAKMAEAVGLEIIIRPRTGKRHKGA